MLNIEYGRMGSLERKSPFGSSAVTPIHRDKARIKKFEGRPVFKEIQIKKEHEKKEPEKPSPLPSKDGGAQEM